MLKQKYKHFKDKNFLISFVTSSVLLTLSFFVNFYAMAYASERASNAVTDIILSNIRVYDVNFIFVQGSIILWTVILLICLWHPQKTPFIFENIALFVLIRAIFISLTHIGPYPTQLVINSTLLHLFTSTGDLFFSGHTGLPFLMALVFWDDIFLRLLFIGASFVFGLAVLLGHLHYSIDVLAAFFITYTIYHLSEVIFYKDKNFFNAELS